MKRGLTLIELLIAIVCMAVMIGVVYQLIVITERVHLRTGARVEAEYAIRETIDLMSSELRHAGYRYWDVLDEDNNNIPPNFAHNVTRIGTESGTNSIIFEADFNEDGTVGDRERIIYQFAQGTRTLSRGVLRGTQTNWDVIANNIDDVQFTYRDANGNVVPMPQTQTDRIRSVNIAFRFAYPVRKEGRTLTTTLNTEVGLRNTYYAGRVQEILP